MKVLLSSFQFLLTVKKENVTYGSTDFNKNVLKFYILKTSRYIFLKLEEYIINTKNQFIHFLLKKKCKRINKTEL
jgi:hypothetical protein